MLREEEHNAHYYYTYIHNNAENERKIYLKSNLLKII